MCSVADLSSFSKSEILRFWSLRINNFGSIFLVGKLLIWDALAAYCSVDKFSSKNLSAGDKHAIMSVYEFPPKDYFNNEVNFDSLYGMNSADSLPLLSSLTVRAVITFRSTWSDLLISVASFACWPVVPVKACFSLPARSTSCSFDTQILLGSFKSCDSIVNEKIQCDLDDTSFRLWLARTRLREPNL